MDQKLLDILICPMCSSKLTFIKNENVLLCRFDRVLYPIDDGIPVLLAEKATSITAQQLESLNE